MNNCIEILKILGIIACTAVAGALFAFIAVVCVEGLHDFCRWISHRKPKKKR